MKSVALLSITLSLILSSCAPDEGVDLEIEYIDTSPRSALREFPTNEAVTVTTSDRPEYSTGTLVDGKTRIQIPLDEYFTVEYESKLSPYDEWYERGTSNTVIVTDARTDSLVVTIPVLFNNDHPITQIPQDDNETTTTCEETDNCTIDNHTYRPTLAQWSDNFTQGVKATSAMIASYNTFWDNITVDQNWDNISIGNPDNYVTCTEPNNIINLYKQKNSTASYVCDNKTWWVGKCGSSMSIAVGSTNDCSCSRNTWTVRPGINNANWGGVGSECRSPSQTLTVFFEKRQ